MLSRRSLSKTWKTMIVTTEDTFADVKFWREPGLVPETLHSHLCVQHALVSAELSVWPTGVLDLCLVPVRSRPLPRRIMGSIWRVGTVGV